MTNNNATWQYKGMNIYEIDPISLGKGIIDVRCDDGGNFFTVLPISSSDHRKQHNTKAAVTVEPTDTGFDIVIIDDYGTVHHITMLGNDGMWMTLFLATLKYSCLLKE